MAMAEPPEASPAEPPQLPGHPELRRLAISALSYRAIAQEREVQIASMLGPDGTDLLSDLLATLTTEITTQLMLSEHLLSRGWSWDDVLVAVWYNEDQLRAAARGD
jgi:hypothetical protein